ncbi:MAG: radical SAM protein [Thermodesulfobacteriota bacterium]
MKNMALRPSPLIENQPEARPEKSTEWAPAKRWNPFNSHKLLSHVLRWKEIKRGRPIPPPVLVTIDPTNVCNLDCVWCNAQYIRKRRHRSLSATVLGHIADFLIGWKRNGAGSVFGVDAVCIAGGGEPLLNPGTAELIDRLTENGLQVGLVTNGTMIHNFIDSLSRCTWVGVSIDAARASTFNRLKSLPAGKEGVFEKVIENIRILVDYSKRHFTMLGRSHPGYGVSYKYLVYNRENIAEIYEASRLAKEIGCKNIHYRPAGTAWDKIGTEGEITFSPDDITAFYEQMALAQELDDETFGVYGITHKFNSQFEKANHFEKCYAIFMTAVFMPPGSDRAPEDAYTLALCCDRRGAGKLELVRDATDVGEVARRWGGLEHWRIHDRINLGRECPRCTYQPHNEIYEQVILNDAMTYRFI